MTVYNIGVIIAFLHGTIICGLSGMGLWPDILVHLAITVWCNPEFAEESSKLIVTLAYFYLLLMTKNAFEYDKSHDLENVQRRNSLND
jgi:hypothetical protein